MKNRTQGFRIVFNVFKDIQRIRDTVLKRKGQPKGQERR